MKRRILFSLLGLFLFSLGYTQSTYPPHGLHKNPTSAYAFVNCNLVPEPGKIIEEGVLIIRNGLVENAGRKLKTPQDAEVIDLNGAYLYPGMIDIYSSYGIGKAPERKRSRTPQYQGSRKGPYAWNDAVKPEYQVATKLNHDPKQAKKWRSLGFTTANAVPNNGIFRGQGALVQMGDGPLVDDLMVPVTPHCMSFSKGSSTQSYPSSTMGAIALIRQTFMDAEWYKEALRVQGSRNNLPAFERNLSLQSLAELGKSAPLFFETNNYEYLLRAARIAQEFGLNFIYKEKGDSYQRLDALKTLGARLIVSLDYPKGYEVTSPADAREVTLRQMMHWEQAPLNAGMIAKSGIPFALSTADLKNPEKEFWPALQKAIEYGLSPEDALASLTTVPAQMLGLEKRIGTLEPGKVANFFITSSALFVKEKATVYETWVSGKRFIQQARPEADLQGSWELTYGDRQASLLIGGKPNQPTGKVVLTIDTLKAQIGLLGLDIVMTFPDSKLSSAGKLRLIGLVNGNQMGGTAVLPDGGEVRWSAIRQGDWKDKEKEPKPGPDLTGIPQPNFPFGPFGFANLPEQQTVLIQNATVWTNTDQGIMEQADVLVQNGRVVEVGKGLRAPGNAQVVDGTGKHVTPGIIDEHSHIAISGGVNESSHAVTAEVSIADVVNATDIDIYRQMAGGVTTSQLLHGSANPIGGQSALIKLRWGMLPEQMKFEGAPGFIKFALGENVKQSNWGGTFTSRYPQTRLGVEQLMRDAFIAARDYESAQNGKASGLGSALPLRRDLQMETLLQILEGQRFVTCHSYVQSEITMLIRLAESFGFRLNTFTHVLEGYKIADKLAAHGANASTFSDWWAYKYEVIDAIPYNAALLHSQGVNVCINSDDAEMGRRLNQEAAKAVKYGGVSEEDALKMVTLNPAKALHIDDRVGSIAPGKDADLVLWSDHPLSVYAKALRTYIDGRLYFDAQRDQQLRQVITQERRRLVKKMLKGGGKGQPGAGSEKKLYHCDTVDQDYQ